MIAIWLRSDVIAALQEAGRDGSVGAGRLFTETVDTVKPWAMTID